MDLEHNTATDCTPVAILLQKFKKEHPQRYEVLKKEFFIITPKFSGDNLNHEEVSYFVDWGKDVKTSFRSRLSLPEFYKNVKEDLKNIEGIKLVPQRNKTSNEIDEEFWEEYFTEDGAFEAR